MSGRDLYLPKEPYLHVVQASVSEITNFGWSLANNDSLKVSVRFLRGRKMKRLSSLYDEFAAALQFPYYFSENWNSFDECITDLEWMPGDAYVLIVTDAESVFSEEPDQFEVLIDILKRAGNEWSQPVETSEAWARPAISFHVVFQCDKLDKQKVMTRLKNVGASFQEMSITSEAPEGPHPT